MFRTIFIICFIWAIIAIYIGLLRQQVVQDDKIAAQKKLEKIEATPTQMTVTVIMPAYAKAEQSDIKLWKKDWETYADRFNRNNDLYNRSIILDYKIGARVNDTVQLKYVSQYNPPQEKNWYVISAKPPFYESQENGQYTYVEYLKGIVTGVK